MFKIPKIENSLKISCRGFSAAELIVALGVSALIFGIVLSAFGNLFRRESLVASTSALAEGIRDARARTLASVEASQYGVKVDADRFTFFRGSAFSSSTPGNETFMFSSWVAASTSIPTIVFERVTGNSSASGTIELYLATSPAEKKTVRVQSTGLVGIE